MFLDIGCKFFEECEVGILKFEELLLIFIGKGVVVVGVEGILIEFVIDVYGEIYCVDIIGVGVKSDNKWYFYLFIDGMLEEVVFELFNEYVVGFVSGCKYVSELGYVSIIMLGNIVDVLVKEGDSVKVGQVVLIIEVMKMEIEVQVGIVGMVKVIYVVKGDWVNLGEILIEIVG